MHNLNTLREKISRNFRNTTYIGGEMIDKRTIADAIEELIDIIDESTDSASVTTDGIATSFVVPHSFGAIPAQVILSPASALAVNAYVSAKTATDFTISYAAAPAAGTANFDYLLR